jgi:hypothetical protein
MDSPHDGSMVGLLALGIGLILGFLIVDKYVAGKL